MIMPVDARIQALQYISLAESQISHGQFHEALASLNRAGELAQEAAAADILSKVYGTLGNIYKSAGRYDDALNNYNIALKIREELAKYNPFFNEWVARSLNNLRTLLADMGRIKEAKARYEGALEIHEKLLEVDRANVSNQL